MSSIQRATSRATSVKSKSPRPTTTQSRQGFSKAHNQCHQISFVFPTIENMGNHVVLFGLLVLALIGLGLASNEPNLVEDGSAAVNEPNNVNSYSDLFGPYSTVFSDYLASVSFLFSPTFFIKYDQQVKHYEIISLNLKVRHSEWISRQKRP